MTQGEQRRTERLPLRIPIRVAGFSSATGVFTEDTYTLVVNGSGALAKLSQKIAAGDEVRITNLKNYSEADFRVVGPMDLPDGEAEVWGVECTERGRNIWGVEFPPPLTPEESAALLECRACRTRVLWPVTLMEVEVLDSTGVVTRSCDQCRKTTYWTYAEAARRPREFSPSDPVAPPVREVKVEEQVEKRTNRRIAMSLPILVRNHKGKEEVTKTENISKGGFAASLATELTVGEQVNILCPYSLTGEKIWQTAEVRRRDPMPSGGKRFYGMRFVR